MSTKKKPVGRQKGHRVTPDAPYLKPHQIRVSNSLWDVLKEYTDELSPGKLSDNRNKLMRDAAYNVLPLKYKQEVKRREKIEAEKDRLEKLEAEKDR